MTEVPKKEEIISFKLMLLGDTSVGKTSFILRFCDDKFEEDSLTTIGIDQKNKYVKVDDKKIELHIWDTAGQERFKSLAKNLFKGADGIILMYDMSNLDSFKAIKKWINDIKESIDITKVGIIIVGNKCDLPEDEIKVDKETKDYFEKEQKMKIIEASAKNSKNVNDSFLIIIKKMIELGLGKKKSDDDEEDTPQKLRKSRTGTKRNNNNCCIGSNRNQKV